MDSSDRTSAISETDIDAGWDLLDAPPSSSGVDAQADEFADLDDGWDEPASVAQRTRRRKPPKRGPRNAENRAARVAKKAADRAAKREAAKAKNRAVNAPKPAKKTAARAEPKAAAPERAKPPPRKRPPAPIESAEAGGLVPPEALVPAPSAAREGRRTKTPTHRAPTAPAVEPTRGIDIKRVVAIAGLVALAAALLWWFAR